MVREPNSNLELMLFFLFGMFVLDNGSILSKIVKLVFLIMATVIIVVKKKVIINVYIIWLVSFCCLAMLSIFWAESKSYAISGSSTILLNSYSIICFIQLYRYANNPLAKVSIWVAIFPILRFTMFLFTYGSNVLRGMRNFGISGYNSLGMFAGLGVIFLVLNYNLLCKKKDVLFYLIAFANIFICILSMSRKALLFLLLPLLTYYLIKERYPLKRIKNFFIVTISVMIIIVIIMNNSFLYRYVGVGLQNLFYFFTTSTGDTSAAGRNTRIAYGLSFFMEKPFWGHGSLNYNFLFSSIERNSKMVIADNNFIDILVNFGLIGFTIYYFIYIYCFTMYFRKKKGKIISKIGLSILITLLICDYGSSSYIYPFSQWYLAMAYLVINDDIKNQSHGGNEVVAYSENY